ncbi:hypothetical protein XELAEV_18001593mg [Xenopus laevis]|nr:hypothetical protein XELAEV_18001593mg [Xenopus laevis]
MAPQYVNLFMAQLEDNFLASSNTRPLTYLQYRIDDILIMWTASEKELMAFYQRFNQFHPNINLILNHSYSHIKFLDTTIYIKNGTIQTSLSQKPTGHISHKAFVNQGSHPQVIDDQIHRATQIPRDTLLDYKEKTENTRSCASSNVVYMITCTGCSTGGRYIGETGQKLRTRMNHHRHKTNSKSCDTPVGQHFCSQNHSLQDMQVLILKGNFKTEQERKIYEFKCMELFNTLRQGLNLGSGFMSHYVI